MTHPQYRKLLLQGHVALESHGLAAQARIASTENVFIGLAINLVKKLQSALCGEFRVVRRKQAYFLMTHIQTDTNA